MRHVRVHALCVGQVPPASCLNHGPCKKSCPGDVPSMAPPHPRVVRCNVQLPHARARLRAATTTTVMVPSVKSRPTTEAARTSSRSPARPEACTCTGVRRLALTAPRQQIMCACLLPSTCLKNGCAASRAHSGRPPASQPACCRGSSPRVQLTSSPTWCPGATHHWRRLQPQALPQRCALAQQPCLVSSSARAATAATAAVQCGRVLAVSGCPHPSPLR